MGQAREAAPQRRLGTRRAVRPAQTIDKRRRSPFNGTTRGLKTFDDDREEDEGKAFDDEVECRNANVCFDCCGECGWDIPM